jgi:hypothetical protein
MGCELVQAALVAHSIVVAPPCIDDPGRLRAARSSDQYKLGANMQGCRELSFADPFYALAGKIRSA